MSVLTAPAPVRDHDPLRDKSYRTTALGPAIAEFLAWLDVADKSPITIDNYERALAYGALMYPERSLVTLEGGDLLQIARSFTPAQRRTRMAAWSSFFKWARRMRKVEQNPCEELPDFKRPKPKVYDVFTEAEIGVLCDLPLRDGALMQLMFDAGIRKAECRHFRLAHLRAAEERELVTVLQGKGRKDREIPATLAVSRKIAELALLDGLERNDHLWYGTRRTIHYSGVLRERPIGEGTFARWWRRCLDDAGVRYRNPHTARHTFATRYLRGGGSIERLKKLMGHDSIKTTSDLYEHLVTADMYAEFDRVFG